MALPSPSPSDIAPDVPEPSSSPSAAGAGVPQKRQRSASMTSGASAERRAPSVAPSDARASDYELATGPSSAFPSAPPTPPSGARDPMLTVSDDDELDDASFGVEEVELQTVVEPRWRDVSKEQKAAWSKDMLAQKTLVPGATMFVVSARWVRRFRRAVGDPDEAGMKEDAGEGPITEAVLGPIDNSDILTIDDDLIPDIVESDDAFYISEDAYSTFVEWYGAPKPEHILPRGVRTVGMREDAVLELRPPKFIALRLVLDFDPALTGPPPTPVRLSIGATVQTLCTALARAAAGPSNYVALPGDGYRVWHVPRPRTTITGTGYPMPRLLEVGGALVDAKDYDKTLEDVLLYDSGSVFAVEFRDYSGWLVAAETVPHFDGTDLPAFEPVTAEPPPLFSPNEDFFSRFQPTRSPDVKMRSPSPAAAKGALKPAAFGSKSTYTAPAGKPRVPGTLGLGNMGNTCFMNSALQCLVHTPELADYFLTDVYKDELNPDNPLGMHGAIAEAFGALLHKIWARAGTGSSYAPREFKSALQRFAPQFSGYQQHDSQELVAFLLDGLHEDLNRILQKPYVEKPDWEGGGERELCALARESWEGYLRRNDSVIVDLFQGQYRSTLVCPECEKVSITFDPFMYLTLPLPQTLKYKTTVNFIPWGIEKDPIRVPIQITKDASFKDLRVLLGKWLDIDPTHLATYETFHSRFFKDLHDGVAVSELGDTDVVVCYELPCPAQQSRSFKRQPTDPFVVPVYLCETPVARPYSKPSVTTFGHPFLVAISPEDAADPERMRRAVTDGLSRWTLHARDLYAWRVDGEEDRVADDEMEEVNIPLITPDATQVETVTEIGEDGAVRDVQEPVPRTPTQVPTPAESDEEDIADAKDMLVYDVNAHTGDPAERDVSMAAEEPKQSQGEPRCVGPKANVFELRLLPEHMRVSSGYGGLSTRFTDWDVRRDEAGPDAPLLRDGDALFAEFEPTVRDYYFGQAGKLEHARFDPDQWEAVEHPELRELRKAERGPKRGMDLQECLDEFVREERLGEDDLWYCPQCKKHQQATKKFDLWRAPDVLVVHLKRFASSRAMRDKIDTFVDFPVEGLDLEPMIEERKVARRLAAQGVDVGVPDDGEPLVYDLFAVDEHLGGLGGGHYRAYALNHVTEKWYHFDDSFVTESSAEKAVNANAYLLFYRRRTSRPLGGKTHEKVEEARARAPSPDAEPAPAPAPAPAAAGADGEEAQLPTPPSEHGGSLRPPGYDSDEDTWMRPRGPLPLQDDADELGGLGLGLETFRTGAALHALAPSPPRAPVVEIPVDESTLEDIE